MIVIATIKRLESQQEAAWFVPTMLCEQPRTAATSVELQGKPAV